MPKSSTEPQISSLRRKALARNQQKSESSSQLSKATEPTEAIKPQAGPQERACINPADIVIYGGSAGGGKTFWLLLQPIYHKDIPGFRAVMFRRTMPNITNAGSMWDESARIYPYANATPNGSKYTWTFPSGARVEFASIQHEKNVIDWKGSQIAVIGFDQVEEFTESQFWYMVSRNRSTCGVKPYIRCTVNPVPEDDAIGGWVHKLIQWWIDKDTGLPIPEHDGVIRWFVRINEEMLWFASKQEAVEAAIQRGFDKSKAERLAKSISFIAARLEDNKKLMEIDPGYYANLMSLPMVERERLYGGNWNIRATAGSIFNRAWFSIVQEAPPDVNWVRYWDKAGTEEKDNPNSAMSAGVKLGYSPSTKGFYVGHCVSGQWKASDRERVIRQTAEIDGTGVTIYVEQEPGSGGKESAYNTVVHTLPGFACFADRVKGDKATRANPFAAQVQAYNVYLVAGDWNEGYLSELHAFSPTNSGRKDKVDASSGAFNKLTRGRPMELLGVAEQTAEEQQRQKDEAAELARQHIMKTGCVFPGEW